MFQSKAIEVAAFLRKHIEKKSRIRILSHLDTDGISAASILIKCLHAHQVPFHAKFSRPLKTDEIMKLSQENYDLFVFVDQGSSQMAAIHKYMLGRGHSVLVLDHHPGNFPEHENLVYLNPHSCGLNGAKDVSAAGIVYSVVELIDKSFRSLLTLAIVGAIGDRQDFLLGFTNINEVLAKRAMDLGLIRATEGLKLIGREFTPLVESLRLSIRPFLPNISGDLEACRSIVNALGVSSNGSLEEIGQEKERKLREIIFSRVGGIAAKEEFCHSIWGTIYLQSGERPSGPRELREYSTMLEACSKFNKPEIGLAAAVGDMHALNEAITMLRNYQEKMVSVIRWLIEHMEYFKVTPYMRYIYAGDAVETTMMGEALSLSIESGLVPKDLPVVGITQSSSNELKVSARATHELTLHGFDVGRALATVASSCGGEGGGHDVSASAFIPSDRLQDLINGLELAFREQVKRGA